MRLLVLGAVALFTLLVVCPSAHAVDRSKFKTCSQSGFCRRTRTSGSFPLADGPRQSYNIVPGSVQISGGHLVASLQSVQFPLQAPLHLEITILTIGVVRVKITETNPKFPRYAVQDVLQADALKPMLLKKGFQLSGDLIIADIPSGRVTVHSTPFRVELDYNGVRVLEANSMGLLQFEQYRDKNPPAEGSPEAPATPELEGKYPVDVDGMWVESWSSHTDQKPRGPSAVSMDVSFTNTEHIYGLPEHASRFALKNTKGGDGAYSEPYRLYNLDVFKYELDEPMALYGAVPFILSHSKRAHAGCLWLNSAETYVDVDSGRTQDDAPKRDVHWISESGIIDTFLFAAPNPKQIMHQLVALTGQPALPQLFSVAYHQCRWNYRDESDVRGVDAGFDEHDIPYDVLWLDIEHTNGKRYFTWDATSFPNPATLQEDLNKKGRKMVTIVDPHIAIDAGYYVYSDALSQNMFVRTQQGSKYEGWCWPGSVSYLDFLNPEVRSYWASQFLPDKYQGSTPSLYTWNDMNEPSVFNGPEVTMPKDCLHHGDVEHRDLHNMYGFYQHMASHDGHLARSANNDRPFILSRSFFAGSQKWGAVWTGDNEAEWSHLKVSLPMVLSIGVAGIPFAGADVGGFFGDPDSELVVRWYQAGAFQPFFRGHAHIETKRREPWVFGEPYTTYVRDAIRWRYALLPYVYSAFQVAHATGTPVMRPMWFEYPNDEKTYDMEEQYMFGSDLLVSPVLDKGVTKVSAYLPSKQPWYDYFSGVAHAGDQTITVSTPLNAIAVFQRAGSIIPRKDRARRSSALMVNDPYTLIVALDDQGAASGQLYIDDGRSFDYLKGLFVIRKFHYAKNTLSCVSATDQAVIMRVHNTVERVVIRGIKQTVRAITLKTADGKSTALEFSQSLSGWTTGNVDEVVIRKPGAIVSQDWSIHLDV